MQPCAFCNGAGNGPRVFSGLVAQALGELRASVHLTCLENAVETLRGMISDPLAWIEILRGLQQQEETAPHDQPSN